MTTERLSKLQSSKEVTTSVFHDPMKAYNGYTLLAPIGGNYVWLVNMQGAVVHKWKMPYPRGLYAELLPNGDLLYAGYNPDAKTAGFIASWGELVEVDWDGNIIWKYSDDYMHDTFLRLRNGNTMVLRWVPIPKEIAQKVRGGWPGTDGEVMWGDSIREINPAGKIVWEWMGYKHLAPETDIICPNCSRDMWAGINSCDVLPNQNILVSLEKANTIAIIDKVSGDIKWRWGRGELCHQHSASKLDNGNIIVFNNGWHCERQGVGISRILEINPMTSEIEWEYKDDPTLDFFSSAMSSCQRLPNENTLICEAVTGRIFEVTKDKQMVWEFINPLFYEVPNFGRSNAIYRAYRYEPLYEGLECLNAELKPAKGKPYEVSGGETTVQ